jgi:DNA polymerase III subunit gamma/tau
MNAIAEDRLHHAYLFTGPRGTGKTSTARILAKAINCEQGPTPTPCNACPSCVEITNGSSVDVIELDMASHGGVDDARELRDRALFSPARSRRKVYILDEVHMASTAAFNALLKLIEEPPGHVLFAMATTDPQKVLPTILSRVQRLDLRRVDAASVAGQVRRICDAEGYRIAEDAVDAVVRAGDGSLRDTLSVLEQVLAFAGTDVTGEAVAQVIGRTPDDLVEDVVARIASHDVAGLLTGVQRLVDQGHDLRRFTLDLAQHLRDLLVLQVAPGSPELVDATAERRQRLAGQSGLLSAPVLIGALEVLGDTVAEQRQTAPRLPLELALARLAVVETTAFDRAGATAPTTDPSRPPSDEEQAPAAADTTAIATEPVPAAKATDVMPAETKAVPAAADPVSSADPVLEPTDAAPADVPQVSDDDDDLARVTAAWPGILEDVKRQSRRGHALFDPAVVLRVGRGMLTLRYGRRYASFHAANARKAEFADVLRTAVRDHCGLDLRLEVVVEGEDDRRRPLPPSVTPDDARVPVLEQAQSPTDVTELLAAELGAQLVEERPAPGE